MASSVIHMCVANEINKKLKKDNRKILIGSIVPDISKLLGESKKYSHFLDNDGIPNIDNFLKKYKNYLDDDFVMGYFIHLYTDYIWFKYFITDFVKGNHIFQADGKEKILSQEKIIEYIYNDYTNLNIKLIDKYLLDLKIFYEPVPKLQNIIDEIPMDKINVIIDKAGIIIENTKKKKDYIFKIGQIDKFITLSTDIILSKINELNLI